MKLLPALLMMVLTASVALAQRAAAIRLETRAEDEIRIFQPVGADTPVRVRLPNWAAVTVEAYRNDGRLIAPAAAALSGDEVAFEYAGAVNGEAVGYYRIRPT